LKLKDIADSLNLETIGNADKEILGLASLDNAGQNDLAFLFSSSYRESLISSRAGAFVLKKEDKHLIDVPAIISPNPRASWAKIANLFDPSPIKMPFISSLATINEGAVLGKNIAIDPHVNIGSGVVIGDDVIIGSGCTVGQGVKIGNRTRLHPNVVVYHDVVIGEDCVLHANSVVGSDGFGYEFDEDSKSFVKIPQIYGVLIGDQVEIGACTTIDRGALDNTVIGTGCKIDNQVQIAHGVKVGKHTVISGCTGISGSTKIGAYCLIGGGVGIVDNIEIADQVEITGMSLVNRSIKEKGRYSSGTIMMPGADWKRNAITQTKLYEMSKRLRKIEKIVSSE
tara:strand:- start:1550 stop:2569 length:1020 start_codon:yes stop_codon:yes gene_type:complete